jgi:hypothetical protein
LARTITRFRAAWDIVRCERHRPVEGLGIMLYRKDESAHFWNMFQIVWTYLRIPNQLKGTLRLRERVHNLHTVPCSTFRTLFVSGIGLVLGCRPRSSSKDQVHKIYDHTLVNYLMSWFKARSDSLAMPAKIRWLNLLVEA